MEEIRKLEYYYDLTLHIQEDSEYGTYIYYRNGSIEMNFYTEENELEKIIKEILQKEKKFKNNMKGE